MYYSIQFAIKQPADPEKLKKLVDKLLGLGGVKDVQINEWGMINIVYDPTKVIPSQLTSIMQSEGVKTYKG